MIFYCFIILQKRTIRVIAGDNYCATTGKRFEETNIMRFANLNKYFTGISIYKYTNDLLPNSFDKLQTIVAKVADIGLHRYMHNTRSAGGLFRQTARANYRKFVISCKGPEIWNDVYLFIALQTLKPIRLFILFWKAYMNKGCL